MKATVFCLLLFSAFSYSSSAQVLSLIETSSLPFANNAKLISLDKLGNIYALSSSQELIKYDRNGKPLCNYREKFLGQARLMDVSNPLRILVFYPEVLTVVELDNMLDIKRRISLEELSLSESSLICRSFDNNFWIFNERAFRIEKYAEDLNLTVQGEWLRNVIDRENLPSQIVEHNKKVYLVYDDALEVFDLFGIHLNTLHFAGIKALDFSRNNMFMLREGQLETYNLETLGLTVLKADADQIKSISIGANLIYLWDGQEIKAYSLSK